jgi:hypothetical protein
LDFLLRGILTNFTVSKGLYRNSKVSKVPEKKPILDKIASRDFCPKKGHAGIPTVLTVYIWQIPMNSKKTAGTGTSFPLSPV